MLATLILTFVLNNKKLLQLLISVDYPVKNFLRSFHLKVFNKIRYNILGDIWITARTSKRKENLLTLFPFVVSILVRFKQKMDILLSAICYLQVLYLQDFWRPSPRYSYLISPKSFIEMESGKIFLMKKDANEGDEDQRQILVLNKINGFRNFFI